MWNTDTLWFEVAIISTMNAVGSALLSHFEVQTSKWKKVVKLLFSIIAITTISATLGRGWAFGFLGLMMAGVLFIHIIWLPRKGINGWTGEPEDKYFELRGWKKKKDTSL